MSENASANRDLDPATIEAFKEAFSKFDVDGDGTITTDELGTVMRSLGQNPTEAELKELIEEVDDDKSGTLDFDEFLNCMADKMMSTLDMDAELMEVFKGMDKNSNDGLTANEIKILLESHGERSDDADIAEFMKIIGSKKPGDDAFSIDEKEFVKMMLHK